jgi:uncharacterized membrane protein
MVMKSSMKTARPNPYAAEYVPDGGFVIAHSQDQFITSNVVAVPIPKSNSSSGGGGGGFSGGGGWGGGSSGKF